MRGRIGQAVFLSLLRQFACGDYAPDTALSPTRQLARRLHASRKAVMCALRQAARCRLVKVHERRPVIVLPKASQRAKQLLNRSRRAERAAHRPTVALLVSSSTIPPGNPFLAALINAIVRDAAREDFKVQIVPWPLDNPVAAARSLVRSAFNAAVSVDFRFNGLMALLLLQELRFPIALYNRLFPAIRVPVVHHDGRGVLRRLVDLLTGLGHRNLCLVTDFTDADTLNDYPLRQWIDCLAQKGILGHCRVPLRYLPSSAILRQHPHVIADLLTRPDRPTALVFTSRRWLEPLLAHPAFRRLSVPEDLSLAVFYPGPRPIVVPGGPRVTTVDADVNRAAECVLEMARRLLDGAQPLRNITTPLDIHLTDSIGPAPRDAPP